MQYELNKLWSWQTLESAFLLNVMVVTGKHEHSVHLGYEEDQYNQIIGMDIANKVARISGKRTLATQNYR